MASWVDESGLSTNSTFAIFLILTSVFGNLGVLLQTEMAFKIDCALSWLSPLLLKIRRDVVQRLKTSQHFSTKFTYVSYLEALRNAIHSH